MRIIFLLFILTSIYSISYSQIIIGSGTTIGGKRIDDWYINPSIGYRKGLNEYAVSIDYYKDKLGSNSLYGLKYKRWIETSTYPIYLQGGIFKSYDDYIGLNLEIGAGKSFKYFGISPNLSYYYCSEFSKLNMGISISFPLKL